MFIGKLDRQDQLMALLLALGSGELQGSQHTQQGQQRQRGAQRGPWVVDHHVPNPTEVMADVGVDARPVGPAAAYAPAYNTNLIPEAVCVTDEWSTRVPLQSTMGEPSLAPAGTGAWAGAEWASERNFLPSPQ